MKPRIYFLLAKVLLNLASFCRTCGICLDYYKQICVIRAIGCSKLPLAEKNELLRKTLLEKTFDFL